jgi:hypothetical protein
MMADSPVTFPKEGALPAKYPPDVHVRDEPAEPAFKPDWESLHAHRDPEWFRDAKFGIYTHWGPVTVGCEDAPQGGEWYGREMYLRVNEGRPNIGYWDAPGDRLHWLVPVKAAGRYMLRGEFSSAYGSSELKVTVADQSRSAEVPKSDGWFRPLFVSFGEFRFDRPGVFHLVLEPAAPEHWCAVNVFQTQLARAE